MSGVIYHLVPESEFRARVDGGLYRPKLLERDGFVHFAGDIDTVLAVALDHFVGLTEPLLLLELDPDRLASQLVYEAAPERQSALPSQAICPHVYGPINCEAIVRVGYLGRDELGYRWPAEFTDVVDVLCRVP